MIFKKLVSILKINPYVLLIALTIIGFEFISFFANSIGSSRLITVPYRGFYILLVFFVLLKTKITKNTTISYYALPVFFFWFIYIIKSLTDVWFFYNEVKDYAADFFLFSIGLCFTPMFPMSLKISNENLRKAKDLTLILAIVVNIWGLKNNLVSLNEDAIGRLLGNEILNPITYGQTGIILIILSITSLVNTNLLKKVIFAGFIVLGLANIALAASRGPMVQLVICILLYFVFNFKHIGAKNLSFIAIGSVLVSIIFADKLILFNTVIDRLNDTGFNTGDGNAERYYLFKEGWQTFLDNPLGYKAIGNFPHNLILESMMALGVFGGCLMIIIFLIAIIESIKSIKNPNTNWLGLILIVQVIAAFTSGAIWNNFVLWPIMILVININNDRRR